MKMLFAVLLLMVSSFAFAEASIDPYVGVSRTDITAYGIDGTTKGGVVGFWMDDHAAIELNYEQDTNLDKYQFNLIGSIVHIYKQRLTWQFGYNYTELSVPGVDITKSFPSIGLGYEIQPFQALTLRAEYNYYYLKDDDVTSRPNGVSLALLYNF